MPATSESGRPARCTVARPARTAPCWPPSARGQRSSPAAPRPRPPPRLGWRAGSTGGGYGRRRSARGAAGKIRPEAGGAAGASGAKTPSEGFCATDCVSRHPTPPYPCVALPAAGRAAAWGRQMTSLAHPVPGSPPPTTKSWRARPGAASPEPADGRAAVARMDSLQAETVL